MATWRRICIIRYCGMQRHILIFCIIDAAGYYPVCDTVLHPLLLRYLLHTRSQRSRRCSGRRYSHHQRRGWPHQLGRKERVLHLIKAGPLTLVSSLGHRAVFGAGADGEGGLMEGFKFGSVSEQRGRGVEKRWGFKDRPGFKPLFSLVCRCRWNVLCVKKKKKSKKDKNGRVWVIGKLRRGWGWGWEGCARRCQKSLQRASPFDTFLPNCWYEFYLVQPFAENSVPCSIHTLDLC